MTKQELFAALQKRLSGYPEKEVNDRLVFIFEAVDDRMEEGLSEEEAIREIGSVDTIANEIIAEIPLSAMIKEKIKPKRKRKTWETVLLWVGSPIWGALLIAALAVVLAVYLSLWAVVVSLFAAFAALVGSSVGGVVGGGVLACTNNLLASLAMIGASLVVGGISIPFFFVCRAAARGMVHLSKITIMGIKRFLMGGRTHA